ncbi:MAG: cytochrome B6 [Bdellovibrionota bacterium]
MKLSIYRPLLIMLNLFYNASCGSMNALENGIAGNKNRTSNEKRDNFGNNSPQDLFDELVSSMKREKSRIMQRQMELLNARYDLRDEARNDVFMFRGKRIQSGVRVKLPNGLSWQSLSNMLPSDIKEKGFFPRGFMPLPHPNHEEGGMVFPRMQIDSLLRQDERDLTRFDLDFDLPEYFLPEFPPPMFLTTRPDLGDVTNGRLISQINFWEIFDGIIPPKQLDGLRLLVMAFPQQQFNQTFDRRTEHAHPGLACFDCHVNGHTNAATHLVGDIRPQSFRHRIDTPTLRGVNIQRLFGSQRALKSIEDFTEFEQRAAYFDGDHTLAAKKGVNTLNRADQVHHMAEFQEMLDFPPAPKLNIFGLLDPKLASDQELRGQDIFFNKGKCGICHKPPYYTDNLMHNLKVERFYKPALINGMETIADGPIKTFPLRGIKESPPYLHDGRLLTLEDTVEFFNLVTGLNLTEQEKEDLVVFMLAL